MLRLSTFDDWIDYFYGWQKDIGLDAPEFKEYKFEAKYGEVPPEIEFGDYKGTLRWKTVTHIPDQRIRDTALNLIVYQGDTEFASVEQQCRLFETAPTRYDYLSLVRVMTEEMRHGWQMSHVLITQFGRSGRIEAQKLLERRAFDDDRLLGAFNEPVRNWLDFFTYTQFVDRDGKFQLTMLSYSSFLPLAQSMLPMLKEENFHLGTGNNGLMRIVKAGRIPSPIIQRYFNKWLPGSYDLFGTDHSSSAHWSYVWGLKGRYNERAAGDQADKDRLNDLARQLYYQEVLKLTEGLNRHIPEEQPKLQVPDLKFNRHIGEHAGKHYNLGGEPLTAEEYEKYLPSVMPSAEDEKALDAIFKERGCIVPKKEEEFEPSEGARRAGS
ncbi:MAG: phenylacetate-CoA oxygenase subunit PaaI [Acidobacteriia bacterium]|nr:phenylacetate-CoA oxygenase subunit PaaI [Terriglobia bacterium]